MTWFQTIFIAILQGATELFPISSLGHAVIVPALLGWQALQSDPGYLGFLVILHFGTAGALLLYFWRDWIGLFAAFSMKYSEARADARRMIFLIIVGTLPVAMLGFVFNHQVKALFANPSAAALFLAVNGVLLHFGDRHVPQASQPLSALTWRQALMIGILQCLALLPGISRSGATMIGGLRMGLSEAEAAHFSFLLATPAILGAGVLEIPKLLRLEDGAIDPLQAAIGGVLAGVVAYLSIMALMAWFRGTAFNAMRPFALYCVFAAIIGYAFMP